MSWTISSQGSAPDYSYWAQIAGVLVPLGAVFKFWVWDFLQMPETLHSRFSREMAEAQASIHERKFLPPLIRVYEQVSARKKIMPTASTMDVLTEITIDAEVRQSMAALAERASMEEAYHRARGSCNFVALPWLAVVITGVTSFFVYQYVQGPWRNVLWLLIAVGGVSTLTAIIGLAVFFRAKNRLIRIIGANKL